MPNHITNLLIMKCENKDRIVELLDKVSFSDFDYRMSIDFEKILPMPKELQVESGSFIKEYLSYALSVLNPNNCNIKSQDILKYREMYDYSGIYFPQLVIRLNNEDEVYIPFSEKEILLEESDIESNMDKVMHGFEYLENFTKYGHTTWYGWCIENWGTKWNSYGYEDFEDEPYPEFVRTEDACIRFKTAWSGIPKLIWKLSIMFTDIRFEYFYADEDTGANVGNYIFECGHCSSFIVPKNYSKEAYEMCFSIRGETAENTGYKFDEKANRYVFVGFDD